jgi:hypothetical protein
MTDVPESKQRALLEVVTAILLGMVSVATALGAYQASQWAGQAGNYLSISQELRDRNLSAFIAADVALADDGERLFEALDLEFAGEPGTPEAEQARAQQEVVLQSATPGLAEAWDEWAESGYQEELFPINQPWYGVQMYGQAVSANITSAAAYELSQALGERSTGVTLASVVWAIALLLLGVSGANVSTRVAGSLVVGGAIAFLGGVAIVVVQAVG